MEREHKLRRLHYMRKRLPHITASALSAVLADVEEYGCVDLHQRKHLKEATEYELAKYTEYGPLLCQISLATRNGDLTACICNVKTLMFAAFQQGGAWTNLLLQTFERRKCSPQSAYNLAVYTDEVVPGNVISHDNRRKCWAIYISIMEFGVKALAQEAAWLTVACQRSSTIAQVNAGIGQLVKQIIKHTFQSDGVDLEKGGFVLKSPQGSLHRLYLKLGCFVQDGAAHRAMFSIKGDSGTRCCLLCKNIISHRSSLVDEAGCEILVTDLVKESQLDLTNDKDIWSTVARLKANHTTMFLALYDFLSILFNF